MADRPFLCRLCGETDPEKFQWVKERRRNKAYREHSMCKKCRNRTRSVRTPEQRKNMALKRDYGLTLEQYYHWLLVVQEGRCTICQRTPDEVKAKYLWPVDHDHKTGQVRGVLCHDCNRGLGGFRDDVEALRRAISYLGGE